MTYLAQLKNLETPNRGTDKTDKTPFVSFGSSPSEGFQDKKPTFVSFVSSPSGHFQKSRDDIRPGFSAINEEGSDTIRSAIQEAIEERAAILEHDAHLSRPQAETQAARAMRVYRYRLSDRPDWLTLIAPGCEPEEARSILVSRFGASRVIEVQPYQPFASGAP